MPNRPFGSILNPFEGLRSGLKRGAELETAFFEIYDGKTPAMWLKHSYPSLKPLGGYINDLVERLKFFQRLEGYPLGSLRCFTCGLALQLPL